MNFDLTKNQLTKLRDWQLEVLTKFVEENKCHPYGGAIGGFNYILIYSNQYRNGPQGDIFRF